MIKRSWSSVHQKLFILKNRKTNMKKEVMSKMGGGLNADGRK